MTIFEALPDYVCQEHTNDGILQPPKPEPVAEASPGVPPLQRMVGSPIPVFVVEQAGIRGVVRLLDANHPVTTQGSKAGSPPT